MQRRNVISLTPLIDVVFILLIFFMLASSFLDWRSIEMNVAKSGAGKGMTGAMLVEIRQDGLRLSGRVLSEPDLLRSIRRRAAKDAELRVLIKPAAGVPLQRSVDLADRIVASGGRDISFLAVPEG